MVDFRIDDGFPQHPKTIGISLEAVGLWAMTGAWCARFLTDGYIPDEVVRGMCKSSRQARIIQELVNRNLWTPAPGGWQFIDWLQYQRSKQDIEVEREQWRKRQERARRKRWKPPDVTA